MPATPQDKSNHVRFDPAFHFFLLPCLFILLVATVWHFVQFTTVLNGELAALVLLLMVGMVRSRMYSLKVQDRLIRLEERLRLAALAGEQGGELTAGLSERQLVALRFASDAELPRLAQRAVREQLTSKQIKEAIGQWRPDYWRV